MQERPAEFGPGWDGIDPFRTLASLDKQENETRMKEFKEYAKDAGLDPVSENGLCLSFPCVFPVFLQSLSW